MNLKDKINEAVNDFENSDLLKDYIEVVETEEDEETYRKAKAIKTSITVGVLALIVLLGAGQIKSCSKNKEVKTTNIENTVDNPTVVDNSEEETPVDEIVEETVEEEVVEETPTEEETVFVGKQIDYSRVSDFYNSILENRNKYGEFAESFQSEEDVKNLIDFIYMFNDLYAFNHLESTINSREQFDEIIRDYYGSCTKHDVKGNLHYLYKEGSKEDKLLAEYEELAYNLKDGNGKDYTIANKFYTWLGANFCIGSENSKDPTLTETVREGYEFYRDKGNMLNARKYQKNDSLDIPSIDVYYAEEFGEGVDVTKTYNAFSCPDSVDDVISKSEEKTETKHVILEEGTELFSYVTVAFDNVLSNGKTR